MCVVPLNVEEEEVQRMLRECLQLREAYVYKEQVAPWYKPVDANTSGKIEDPFHFYPVEKTHVSFSFLITTFFKDTKVPTIVWLVGEHYC